MYAAASTHALTAAFDGQVMSHVQWLSSSFEHYHPKLNLYNFKMHCNAAV